MNDPTDEYLIKREQMVKEQIAGRGIEDTAVLEAMRYRAARNVCAQKGISATPMMIHRSRFRESKRYLSLMSLH